MSKGPNLLAVGSLKKRKELLKFLKQAINENDPYVSTTCPKLITKAYYELDLLLKNDEKLSIITSTNNLPVALKFLYY